MPEAFIGQRKWKKWGLIAAGWAAFAIFFASESIISRAYAARPLQLGQTLVAWLLCATLWFLLTPAVLWLAHRFPLDRSSRRLHLMFHLGAGAVLAVSHLALYVTVFFVLSVLLKARHPTFAEAFRNQFI